MNEEQAREATRAIVGDAALERIERFLHRVREEAGRQNLRAQRLIPCGIATRSTLPS